MENYNCYVITSYSLHAEQYCTCVILHAQKSTQTQMYSIFTHHYSIDTAGALWGIRTGVDATCSLSAHSRFKQLLQSCEPPTPPIVP